MRAGQCLLELGVVIYLPFLHIHHHHLAGTETPFLAYLGRVEGEDACLGGDDDSVIVSDEITCRAESVTVEHTSGIASVAEQQRRRAVPRLHKYRMILVERLQPRRNRVAVVERLRHEHCQSVRQAHPCHHEILEHIVERRRVAHAGLDDGGKVTASEHRRVKHALAGLHPQAVALDSVYLTIVAEHPEWLCQRPCGECICRKA